MISVVISGFETGKLTQLKIRLDGLRLDDMANLDGHLKVTLNQYEYNDLQIENIPPRSAIRHALTYKRIDAILVTDTHVYDTSESSAVFTSSVD